MIIKCIVLVGHCRNSTINCTILILVVQNCIDKLFQNLKMITKRKCKKQSKCHVTLHSQENITWVVNYHIVVQDIN